MKRVFVSDCEGPISKNDNAFELMSHFVPRGDKLFAVVSRYDDIISDLLKRQQHKPGSTLKLILPFLKAWGVTDSKMKEFAERNLLLIDGARETLIEVSSLTDAFVVSASYEHYVRALCQTIGFPFENAYCTRLEIDKYSLNEREKVRLKDIASEIGDMHVIEIPQYAKSVGDISQKDREIIQRLDEIFHSEIACTDCGRMYSEVNPVGGSEKVKAVEDVVMRTGTSLADIVYVGDSITDEEALTLVKENGGLAVSFNGNQYAIRSAEIAILSENSIVTSVIADIFIRFGKERVLELVENWSSRSIEGTIDQTLLDQLLSLYPATLPKVEIVKRQNTETLIRESSEFRKKVRGKAIGRLG